MEGLLDRASPRRGSLNSLHRYPSVPSSHSAKQSSPTNTLQVSNTNLYTLCKELDKFTRYFIVKAVQVIVQSRQNGSQKVKTDCKPSGNDWFNLNIPDIVDVSEKTRAVLDTEGLSVKANWRVCCEISLKTNDGGKVVLEHWIISNKTNFNSNLRLNADLPAQKGFLAGKTSVNHLTSSNISSGSMPPGVINSSGRVRTATFSSTSRTRLNSIDDSDGTGNGLASNRFLLGANNENVDIKPSTSCFSLSHAQGLHSHTDGINNLLTESPSTNSLSTNNAQSSHAVHTNHTQDHQQQLANNNTTTSTNSSSLQSQSYPTKSTSSIYTIYNKMSLLLKTLLTTAHIVPAYRLASQATQTDSCVICCRVYSVARPAASTSRGSIEEININYPESPNRRSQTSTTSLGSIDIREFVSSDELDQFCPILKLGSIKTDINELDISLCYRTDTRNSSYLLESPRSRKMYNRILDEDCLVAAKQLLAGNVGSTGDGKHHYHHQQNHTKNGSCNSLDRDRLAFLNQPLRPAFANNENQGGESTDRFKPTRDRQIDGNNKGDDCTLIESAFEKLLQIKTGSFSSKEEDNLVNIANAAMNSPTKTGSGRDVDNCKLNNGAKSEPIQVPGRSNQHLNNLITTPGSTPKSLSDSYVFVDLNPPFASDEQNDLNSFFHGPTPTFANGLGSSKDVKDLTCQLATIEANASQIDEFVDEICVSEDDEEKEEEEEEEVEERRR